MLMGHAAQLSSVMAGVRENSENTGSCNVRHYDSTEVCLCAHEHDMTSASNSVGM